MLRLGMSSISSDPDGPFVTDLPNAPGRTVLDPSAPGYPIYHLLSGLRSPLTLRELMIDPIRRGYIGTPGSSLPEDLPPSAEVLFPEIQVRRIGVRCEDGVIECRVYSPPEATNGARRPVIVYFHGGGFTVGSAQDTASITSRLARDVGAVVVSVNYRMAPEWPFPYAVEDCFAVYRTILQEAAGIGGDPDCVAVAGDSAGGNLAAALPLVSRDREVSLPTATLLLCPITNFSAEDHPEFEELAALGVVYDTPFFGFIRAAYLQRRCNWTAPYASPICGDLTGFPPTLVVAGTADPMIGDNRAFVEKLKSAGSDATLHEAADMPHGYYFFPGLVPDGDTALAAAAEFLKRTLRKSEVSSIGPANSLLA